MKLSDIPRSNKVPYHSFKQLLLPMGKVRAIGVEKEKKTNHPNIILYVNPQGSNRYIWVIDGEFVSVVQVMVMPDDKKKGVIATAYTLKEHRRMGHAKDLLKFARKTFTISHSKDLSGDGKEFAKSTG